MAGICQRTHSLTHSLTRSLTHSLSAVEALQSLQGAGVDVNDGAVATARPDHADAGVPQRAHHGALAIDQLIECVPG